MRVGVDREHTARVGGQREQPVRRVLALRPAVDLHGYPRLRARAEHCAGIELRLRTPSPPAQHPAGAVPQHGHLWVADRGYHPPGHRAGRHAQLGVDTGHHHIELPQQVLTLVQRAVVEDVNLDAGQDAEGGQLLVQLADQLELARSRSADSPLATVSRGE
jgi:hypothetical protein